VSLGVELLEDRLSPAVITVVNNGDSGPGSLRDSLFSAANGDTITFAPTLTGGQIISLATTLNVTQNNLTISNAGSTPVTITGNGSVTVFNVTGTNDVIDSLTIFGGWTSQVGGGIYLNAGLSLTVSNCSLKNNTSSAAGGAIGTGINATLMVSNCSFSNNTYDASAIWVAKGDNVTLANSIFTSNTFSAIDNLGTVAVNNCTFIGNTVAGGGGAALNNGQGCTMTVTNSTFSNNSQTNQGIFGTGGGAIYDDGGTLTISGSTFSRNTAQANGGAINCNVGSNFTVTNCTFTNNTSDVGGGAVAFYGGTNSLTNLTVTGNRTTSNSGGGLLVRANPGGATLINSIVAGNFVGASPSTNPDDISGVVSIASCFNNLIGTGGSGGLVNAVNGNLVDVTNPGLDSQLRDNGGPTQTIALLPGSPAIDAGTTVGAPATDQRGFPRLDTPDIGAYEVLKDEFNRADSATLGPGWQIPPLSPALRFTYRRRLGFGGFQLLSNAAVSVGPSYDGEQVTGVSLHDATLQADVNAGNSQTLAVGLLARIQSNGDAYGAILTNSGLAEIILSHGATNSFTVLGMVTVGTNVANLQFSVSGSTLSLSCAGASISLNDNILTAPGGVGLFAWGPNGIIDNFSVSGS
jgi:hypothetical protein